MSLALLILYFSIHRVQAQSWTWINPKPQGNSLKDVIFFDEMRGIAIGDFGTIVRTSDGGNTWAPKLIEPNVEVISGTNR